MTNNTREVDEIVNKFEDGISSCALTETTCCYGLVLSKLAVIDWLRTTLPHQLQKARESEKLKLSDAIGFVMAYYHPANTRVDDQQKLGAYDAMEMLSEKLKELNQSELDQDKK